MTPIWNRRGTRIMVGVLLLGAGILVLLPGLTGTSSLDGTVNARFVVISSPIQGVVQRSPPRVGTRVPEGETVLEIRNERLASEGPQDLQGELTAIRRRLDGLATQKVQLEELRADLLARLESYQDAAARNLQQTLSSQRERIGVGEARVAETQATLSRALQLRARELTTETDIERSRAANLAARREVDISRNELERLQGQLAAARGGIYVGEGRNDVPYSRQRLDEVSIALAELGVRQTDLEALEARTRQRITLEEEQRRALGEAPVASPISGVVWRNNVVEGSNVIVGTELMRVLDCRNLFVDILVSEGHYDNIVPGQGAEVRLYGSGLVFPGVVESVRGSSAVVEEPTLAAVPPQGSARNARIRLRLNPSELNRDYQNFCQVGRTVQVRFRSGEYPFMTWLRGLWFSIS